MVAKSYDPMQLDAAPLRPSADVRQPPLETKAAPIAAAMLANRTVVAYLLVSVALLVPGLVVWALSPTAWQGTPVAPLLDPIARAMDDIHFARGFRFWAGVAGATAMALLLLYPLRKAFGGARRAGRVSSWFHLHIVLGLAGPVLVLYHCFFGLGAPDANVALATMVAVVFSGIIGQFAHRTASAQFHTMRREARAHFDAVLATLGLILENDQIPRELADGFTDFDAHILTPSRGLIATMAALARLERQRRALARSFGGYVNAHGTANGLPDYAIWSNRRKLGDAFGDYMKVARRAAARSLFDQLWGRWRLFHLPAFLVMVVATGLHVYAVWPKAHAFATATTEDRAVLPPPALQQPGKPKAAVPRHHKKAAAVAQPFAPPPAPTLIAPPKLIRGEAIGALPGARTDASAAAERIAAAKSAPSTPGTSLAPVNSSDDDLVKAVGASANKYHPAPVAAAMPAPAVVPAASPPPSPEKPATEDLLAQLQKHFETPQVDGNRSALGGVRSLDEQIADYKAKLKSGAFHHAQSETGFALVGRHTRVDCAKCHTAPLRDGPSSSPRPCKSCHMKDDVHHGRRPQCANCHEPTNWRDTH